MNRRNRPAAWPFIAAFLAVVLLSAWTEPCDNAPDCRPSTALTN